MSEQNLIRLKAETEALLRSWGVAINPHLPLLEDIAEVRPRLAAEVARRICALGYLAGLGFGESLASVQASLAEHQLAEALSEQECQLLLRGSLTRQQEIDCSWLTEAIQALMWSLGRAALDHSRLSDDDLADRLPLNADPSEFIATAERRPLGELQRECDVLYRLHWFARHCRRTGVVCRFSESAIRERRRALDWVYGVHENWDEVAGDT